MAKNYLAGKIHKNFSVIAVNSFSILLDVFIILYSECHTACTYVKLHPSFIFKAMLSGFLNKNLNGRNNHLVGIS